MAVDAPEPSPPTRVSLKEVEEVLDALYRSGRPLSCPLRYAAPGTVGVLSAELPDAVALTIALRVTFTVCTPPEHLRRSVEASQRHERETIDLLRNYLRRACPAIDQAIHHRAAQDDRARPCAGVFPARKHSVRRLEA